MTDALFDAEKYGHSRRRPARPSPPPVATVTSDGQWYALVTGDGPMPGAHRLASPYRDGAGHFHALCRRSGRDAIRLEVGVAVNPCPGCH